LENFLKNMFKINKPLGEILKEKKMITEEKLQEALKESKEKKEFLGQVLIRKGFISEDDLLKALAEQFSLKVVSLKYKYINVNLLKRFSPTLIFDHYCLPLEEDENSVTFAITNPLDIWTIKKAEEEAGNLKAKFVLSSLEDIKEVILRCKEYLKKEMLKGI